MIFTLPGPAGHVRRSHIVGLRMRMRARQTRDRLRAPRGNPLVDVIATWHHNGREITLRAPRYPDYADWYAVRIANQRFLEPYWDSLDDPWEHRHGLGDWIRHVDHARLARRQRTALLNVVVVDGRVAGEFNLEWIHEYTGTAEYGAWIDAELHGSGIIPTIHDALGGYAFEDLGLARISAPVSIDNAPTLRAIRLLGFRSEGVLRDYGKGNSGRVDHELYSLTKDDFRHQRDTKRPQSPPDFTASIAAQARLHDLVPGGAHTYARGEDQYPDGMAPILKYGLGSHVWDIDGNEFIEYGSGLRSVTLGHAFPPVTRAVTAAIADGVNFSRPTALELAAAEDFLSCVPTAEMVKFAKNGSDTTTAAIRLARAATGRSTVAICNQPFFSVDDWFIGTTPMSAGSRGVDTVTFDYNDLDSLRTVLAENEIAAVVMEAATAMAEPAPGYLEAVRQACTDNNTILIFDEMITGFRWSAAGAQSVYGVTPDLSCWGKALGNGFPISALAGRRDLMEAGGLRAERDRVFLLSTTHGPESASLAAMRAVIETYRSEDPVEVMTTRGTALADGINARAAEFGLTEHFYAAGRPSCLVFVTKDAHGNPSQEFRTLAMSELIRNGVLGQSLVLGAAHTPRDVDKTIDAFTAAMPLYRKAIDAGDATPFLSGRPVTPALRATGAPRTPFQPDHKDPT